MELSMYMTYALGQNFPTAVDAFRYFYDKGVRYGDMLDTDLDGYSIEQYVKDLKESRITPNTLVCMANIASFDKAERTEKISLVKGYIDKMGELSVPLIMLAPDVTPARSREEAEEMRKILISSFGEMCDYARKSGVKVAMENQSTHTRADSRAEDIRFILDEIPDLGFVFDIGNFFCVGEDALKAYELLSHRLVHVHAKDWIIDPYGDFVRENLPRFTGCAIGNGIIPVKEIINRLRKDEYDGKIVLEVNKTGITLDILSESAEFLRSEIYV